MCAHMHECVSIGHLPTYCASFLLRQKSLDHPGPVEQLVRLQMKCSSHYLHQRGANLEVERGVRAKDLLSLPLQVGQSHLHRGETPHSVHCRWGGGRGGREMNGRDEELQQGKKGEGGGNNDEETAIHKEVILFNTHPVQMII